MIGYILTLVIGGLLWAWRGSKYTLGNFLTAFICSTGMVLTFNYFVLNNALELYNIIGAICCLALTEIWLGYGKMTFFLNGTIGVSKWFNALRREAWAFLALVSMTYCLLPSLFLLPNKRPIVYIVIAIIGVGIFPLAKYISMQLDKKKVKFDTWKVAEYIIGVGIMLAWIIGSLLK